MYQNEICNRKFATIKEMNRHYRNNHQNRPNIEALYNCPLTDYNKTYKTLGWLNKHILPCHPEYNQPIMEIKTPINKKLPK